MWTKLISSLMILPIIYPPNCFSVDKKTVSQQYYQQGVKLYEAGKTDSAIIKFRTALKKNRKLADAHNQLGLIYMDQGTVHSRFLSGLELERAIKLDWYNPEYRFNNALLFLKKGMEGSALREFKKVIKYDPQNFMAYYHCGLIKEKEVMRYRDMIDPGQGGIVYFRKFAENDKQRAVYYFNKTIALNPQFTEVYYRLGLIYYEFDELDEMIGLLQKAVKINPEDKNCHLFLGFAYAQNEDFKLAQQEYEQAIKLMQPDERQLFHSIDLIISPEQKTEFDNASLRKQKKMAHTFWQAKDPFLMTEFNERKLEHYNRIAYANLRYSRPEKNIEGWQTDQGKVYIRFGKPETLYRTRPGIDVTASSGFSSAVGSFFISKESWIYPNFQFIFEDRFLTTKYEFAWGSRPETDYRSVYEQMIKDTPDYYQYIPEEKKLEIAADFTNFKAKNDNTVMDVGFSVPADSIDLLLHNNKRQANVRQGVFLVDEEWGKNYNSINEYNWTEELITEVGTEKYFIDRNSLTVEPGHYNLVIEVHDLESNKRNSLRKTVDVTSFNTNELQLSDILLAFNIECDSGATNFARENLIILPNPLKKFPVASPISIYYEIYNLSQDSNGFTSFRIENKISSNREKVGTIKNFLTTLGLVKIQGDVTTSYLYEGTSPTEYQYQSINLSKRHQEDLILTVKVTDLRNNQTAVNKVEFKLESEE